MLKNELLLSERQIWLAGWGFFAAKCNVTLSF
jgi:hypothetical protein